MSDMTPITVQRYGPGRKHTSYCHIEDCNRFTLGGKRFCSHHINHQSYVQNLLRRISEREEEEMRVESGGWKAVDIEGSIAQDTLRFLRIHGPKTVRRLAKDLNRNSKIQACYVEALRKAGLVDTRCTQRGYIIATAA